MSSVVRKKVNNNRIWRILFKAIQVRLQTLSEHIEALRFKRANKSGSIRNVAR